MVAHEGAGHGELVDHEGWLHMPAMGMVGACWSWVLDVGAPVVLPGVATEDGEAWVVAR